MSTALSLLLAFVILLVLYLDLLAWLVLARDETLANSQKLLQALVVLLVPLVGSLVVLRLCELAHPGSVAPDQVPWPFRAIVTDRPLPPNKNRESWEEFRRRYWNL